MGLTAVSLAPGRPVRAAHQPTAGSRLSSQPADTSSSRHSWTLPGPRAAGGRGAWGSSGPQESGVGGRWRGRCPGVGPISREPGALSAFPGGAGEGAGPGEAPHATPSVQQHVATTGVAPAPPSPPGTRGPRLSPALAAQEAEQSAKGPVPTATRPLLDKQPHGSASPAKQRDPALLSSEGRG